VSPQLVLDIAAYIRRVDGGNRLHAEVLGTRVAEYLHQNGISVSTGAVAAFVERTNADKRMGAAHLAELIVAEFRLDEEY
jgi:hypothetical protein